MSRPTKDEWGLSLALATSRRATCLRRAVGCVLVDGLGHILATGYNGVAAGQPHCNERGGFICDPASDHNHPGPSCFEFPHACPGAHAASGTMLDACQAIHAEQNALLQCRDVQAIHTCYVTASPCMTCVKLLMNTGCRRIVFLEEYPAPEARTLWLSLEGRSWVHQSNHRLK